MLGIGQKFPLFSLTGETECSIRVLCAIALVLTSAPGVAAEQSAVPDEPTRMGTIKVEGVENPESTGTYAAGVSSGATGLSLSLRDTPQSVTVITRERMDDQAMATVFDVLRNTTGVSVQPVDRGRSTLAVRGFEVKNFQFDGVPTAVYSDDVNANTVMFDRIEVVRGATGLLSGTGDPSASVNLVRKHANSETLTGSISAELGSWDQQAGTLDVTAPVNEAGSVRTRWVAHASRQDAFVDLESTKNTVFYGVIDADVSTDTRLSVGASDQRDKRSGVLWAGLPYWYSDGTRTDWDRSKTTATRWNQWDVTEQTLFATLEHTLQNRWKIRGDASYIKRRGEERMLWMWGDPDRATGQGMEAYPYHYIGTPRQAHVDVMASGPFTLWGREQEVTTGIMYSRQRDGWSNRDAELPVASFPVGDFNVWDGSYAEPAWGPRYQASKTTTTQSAVYAATRLQLTDPLKLIAGARLSHWKRQEAAAVWTPAAYEIRHDRVFTPYVGGVYELSGALSAYASYTSIFNPQTARDRNGAYLDPLEGTTYEAGLKGEFFGGMLNASAAVFRVDQDNFAVADVGQFVPGTIEQAFRTAQGVKVQGYELEMVGELARGWSMSLGWTHYSAKDAEDADVAVDHPREQFKLFAKYVLPGLWDRLSVGGGVNWSGAQPARATNPASGQEEKIGQPAYALVDLLAKYAFNPQWSAQLNINNALDKEYVSRNTGWWGGPYTYGEPRKVLLTMDCKF